MKIKPLFVRFERVKKRGLQNVVTIKVQSTSVHRYTEYKETAILGTGDSHRLSGL